MHFLQRLLACLFFISIPATAVAQNQDVIYAETHAEAVNAFDASYSASLIAVAVYPYTDVVLYDLFTADEVFRVTGNTFTATAMHFDAAGTRMVIHYPDKTQVWDITSFQKQAEYATDFYAARDFSFATATFVSYQNNSLQFKDLNNAVVKELPYADAPARLMFSKNGNALFGLSNGQLRYVDVQGNTSQKTLDIKEVSNFVVGDAGIAIQQTEANTQGSDVRLSFYDFSGTAKSEKIQPKTAFQTFAARMHLFNDELLFYESFDKVVVVNSNGGEDTFEFKEDLTDFKFVKNVGFAVNFKNRLDLLDTDGNLITRLYAKSFMNSGSYVNPDSERVALVVDSVLFLGDAATRQPKQISLDDGLANAVTGAEDLIAFATRDQKLRLWDLKSAKERVAITTQEVTFPQFVQLDPSGKLLLACYPRADKIVVYDVRTGKEKARLALPQEEQITALDFDGKQLVVGTQSGAYAFYQLGSSGFELQRDYAPALSNAITGVSISGSKVAVSSLGRMLQLRLDQEAKVTAEDVLIGHSGFIHGIAYDATGTYLTSADTYGDIHFWEADKQRLVHRIHLDSAWVKNLSLHDSLYISSSGPGMITGNFYNPLVYQKITDPKPELLVQRANTNAIRKLVFSRDGKLLASDDGSVIKVREVQTGFLISEITLEDNTLNDLAFLKDNNTLVVASGSSVEFIDAYTGTSKKFLDFNTRNRSIHQVESFPDLNIVVGLNIHGWHYPLLIHSNSGLVMGTLEVNPAEEKDQQIINLIISPDGKRIATYGNKYIKVFEINEQVQTRQVAVIPRDSPDVSNQYWNDLMHFNAEGTRLAYVEMGSPNRLKVLDIASGSISYETTGKLSVFGYDGELVGMVNSNVRLSALKQDATTWERLQSEHEHMDLISSLAYDPINTLYASADIWGNIITWDAETKTPLWELDRFANDIYSVDLNAQGDVMAFNAKSGLFLFDLQQFKIKKLEGNNYPYYGAFSKDGSLFFYRNGKDYHVYRPENDKSGLLFKTPVAAADASGSLLSEDGSVLSFKNTKTDVMYSYDIHNKALLGEIKLKEIPGYLSLTVASVTREANTKLQLQGTALKTLGDSLLVFNKVNYTPSTQQLSVNSKEHFINLKENKEFLDYKIKYHTKLNAYSDDGKYYAYLEDFHLKIEDLERKELLYDQYIQDVRIVDGVFTEDSKSLILAFEDGAVKIMSLPEFKVTHTFLGSTGQLSDMDFKNHFLVILGGDNLIKVFDRDQDYKLLYSCAFLEDGEFILSDEEGFYYASKAAREAVAFKKGDEVYPFEQFDMFYNRPDKAIRNLVSLGITDSLLQKGYEMAYQKRLSKMGFDEGMLSGAFELPTLELLTKDLPATTNEEQISFRIKAEDRAKNLDRILVWVNDVPVFGAKGKSIRDLNIQQLEETLTVNLASGTNKVQVSVVNSSGVESLKRTFVINATAAMPQPDLYLVSIGVSKYQNEDFNLKYAAKDAKDLMDYVNERPEAYAEIHTHNLVNEQVTTTEIAKLKARLMQSRTNDVVIVFFAGHGVLDEEMNYYLGTYDIDFDNPKKNGLAYDGLENLLDGIPALNKLLIIDACHSGEVDQDDATIDTGLTNAKVSGKRGSIAVKSKSKQLGLENSFELMQMLFSDLRRGTGATVISSASGLEYAYEGEAWQNGVFTYAMLEGLKSGACDLNGDGSVQVSELKSYVFDKVSELTNGKQNPTSRKENLEYDFKVW